MFISFPFTDTACTLIDVSQFMLGIRTAAFVQWAWFAIRRLTYDISLKGKTGGFMELLTYNRTARCIECTTIQYCAWLSKMFRAWSRAPRRQLVFWVALWHRTDFVLHFAGKMWKVCCQSLWKKLLTWSHRSCIQTDMHTSPDAEHVMQVSEFGTGDFRLES